MPSDVHTMIHPPTSRLTHSPHLPARVHTHLLTEEIRSALPVSAKDVKCSDGTLTIGPMTAVSIGLAKHSLTERF